MNPQHNNNIKEQDMMETGGICFHGKMGVCEGGVCRSIDEKCSRFKYSQVDSKQYGIISTSLYR